MGAERRLPASYANFYIGNDVVMVPVFGHKNDEVALKIIQEAFPERKVVGINCREMVHGPGDDPLHQPAAADGVKMSIEEGQDSMATGFLFVGHSQC